MTKPPQPLKEIYILTSTFPTLSSFDVWPSPSILQFWSFNLPLSHPLGVWSLTLPRLRGEGWGGLASAEFKIALSEQLCRKSIDNFKNLSHTHTQTHIHTYTHTHTHTQTHIHTNTHTHTHTQTHIHTHAHTQIKLLASLNWTSNITSKSSLYVITNSLFHKTLPKSSLQMHWISVRFYETCDIWHYY